jgi:2'-5' RNA ligase
MSRIRTFVAIEATDEIRSAAERVIRKLAGDSGFVRWVEPHNLHLSLKFLGDVEDRDVYGVCAAIQRVAADHASFHIECCSLGAFPCVQRPRTIWMGVRDEADRLTSLQGSVEDALCELGFPVEARQFQGHLTLGRIRARPRETAQLQDAMQLYSETEFGNLPVDELIVYASELTREGPHYTVLGRGQLS